MTDMQTTKPLLEVRNLKRHFPVDDGFFVQSQKSVKAVDGVDLAIAPGEALGLVGESGCGKSTLGRNIVRLDKPTAGEIRFEGVDIAPFGDRELKPYRRQIQIIFQNPFSSLNPRLTVGNMLMEPLMLHGEGDRAKRRQRALELLELVGLGADHFDRYPHEFSGGQRQRLGIARALALRPKLIVCDEPVSALDVSIQSQIINLLRDLQEEFQLSYLFISHDLSVVEHMCDRVAVMYLGRIVEIASAKALYEKTFHPYTRALLSALPIPDPTVQTEEIILEGSVPSPVNPPPGCHFSTRCPFATPSCSESTPELREFEPGHFVRCSRLEEIL
ncbi:dipeptide ABC transporter ATP-binding protein [Nitratireductor sp. ac15]|uniref:ABC transporter ATP-binding protein n=2 Tax=unclassified Nitratireductor TaxID=2641084 RepID=UPI0025F8E5AE|nr:dipeptide ABC transporter ATP-binding protein [Nitratireductor sp.]